MAERRWIGPDQTHYPALGTVLNHGDVADVPADLLKHDPSNWGPIEPVKKGKDTAPDADDED